LAKPRFVVPYAVARVGAVLGTGALFYGILYFLGGVLCAILGSDPLPPRNGAWLAAIGLSCVPLFATHGAFVSFPDLYARGFFRLPDASLAQLFAQAQQRGATNPWRAALWATGVLGVPIGVLSFWLVPSLPSEQLAVSRYLGMLAGSGALLAAGTFYVFTGRSFLREAAVLPADRRYPGTASSYLWERHVLPQALVNLWLNAWVAAALVRGPLELETSGVGRDAVLTDVFATGMFLAVAVGSETVAYARFDQRWRVSPLIGAAKGGVIRRPIDTGWYRNVWVHTSLLLALPAVLTAVVYGVLVGLGIDHLRAWPFTVGRGVLWGLYAGGIALWFGRWTLATPERAHRPGQLSHRTTTSHLGATAGRSLLRSRELD
jgi:hypothetical protein